MSNNIKLVVNNPHKQIEEKQFFEKEELKIILDLYAKMVSEDIPLPNASRMQKPAHPPPIMPGAARFIKGARGSEYVTEFIEGFLDKSA